MTPELEQLRALRPEVTPASDQARSEAWQRLMAAIEDEPDGLHARRHADPSSPRRGGSRARRTAGRLRPRLAIGTAIAVVVGVVAAVVILAGRHPSAPVAPVSPATPGTITAGGRPLSPGVIRKGLEQTYHGALAAGQSLDTSLSPALMRTGRTALGRAIAVNHGAAGAYVAMDPRTGAIRAIGSLSRGHDARSRQIDLAVGLAAPPGDTIAPITALAALRSGAWSTAERFDDVGHYCVRSATGLHCRTAPGHTAYGTLDVAGGLANEDDPFLDDLGVRAETTSAAHPGAASLQATARELGLDATTGIDLPGQTTGTLPSPGATRIDDGRGSPAEDENLATGRTDVSVSPIQLAVAYAAIASGGTIVRPHVVTSLRRGGRTRAPAAGRRGTARIATAQLAAVRDGLRRAVTGGVLADTLESLPVAVSGQVGSPRYAVGGRETGDAWFAGYAPASDGHGPLVAVVWVDGGGFGDVAAAPVARELFSQWFTGRPGPYVAGSSTAG